MKLLNLKDVQQVSGGDIGLVINSTVPTADVGAIASAIGALLTGTLDAAALGAQLTTNAAQYNDMGLNTITIGNFVITPT